MRAAGRPFACSPTRQLQNVSARARAVATAGTRGGAHSSRRAPAGKNARVKAIFGAMFGTSARLAAVWRRLLLRYIFSVARSRRKQAAGERRRLSGGESARACSMAATATLVDARQTTSAVETLNASKRRRHEQKTKHRFCSSIEQRAFCE